MPNPLSMCDHLDPQKKKKKWEKKHCKYMAVFVPMYVQAV